MVTFLRHRQACQKLRKVIISPAGLILCKNVVLQVFQRCAILCVLLPVKGGENMTMEEFFLSVLASLVATLIAGLVRKWLD